MNFRSLFRGIAILLLCTSCEISDVQSSSMDVTFVIPENNNDVVPSHPRYTVLWLGHNLWKVTADGPVSPNSNEISISIDTPKKELLEKVLPAETLMYSVYNLPQTPVRRPRIVIYDDLNHNQQFDIHADRILALDGFGLSYYASIVAILDLDAFLSQLSIAETQIYYGWTDNEYRQLLYGAAEIGWFHSVTPLFEEANRTESAQPPPSLELQTASELLMKKDLECFRDTNITYDFKYKQFWVDSTLDTDLICAATTTPCGAFDASFEPNFEDMAQTAQIFETTCGTNNTGYQTVSANIGVVECTGCVCTVIYDVIVYYLNTEMVPIWSPCFAQSVGGTLSESN